ncbi:MAG: RNA methyltransferase [Acidobacteria bacterium]|nr:RNA methyltransferase [Acidobacteriota bacterium]
MAALGVRHPEVERLRRLLRRADARASEAAFVLEGPKLLSVALDAGADLEAVYVAEDGRSVAEVVERARQSGVPIRVLARGVVERVADTVTPQPVLTLARSVTVPVEAVVTLDFVVVAVDVQDPGNAGTIIRSAEAAGAGAVLFVGASVDPLSPKTVRASAGAVFQIAVVDGGEPAEMLDQLGAQGLWRLGAVGAGGTPCDQADLTRPVALVLGNEAHGLPDGLPLDGMVSIPIMGSAESLNVAMAASILCYEVARQRRTGGGEG